MAAADGAPSTGIDVAGVVPSECSVARVGWSVLLSGSWVQLVMCGNGGSKEATTAVSSMTGK